MATWIQEGFTAEPPRNDSGSKFGEMIRVSARKSGLRAKSRSYRPKVRAPVGRRPESELNRPEKEPESGLGASTENPLKAFLNPPNIYIYIHTHTHLTDARLFS